MAPPPAHPPSPLHDALEAALMDALNGDPAGPALYGRLRTIARAHLLQRGLGAAQIEVGPAPGGVRVAIRLPPGPARVAQLVLTLSTG